MRAWALPVSVLLVLAGCLASEESPANDVEASDAEAVADAEATAVPPPKPPAPVTVDASWQGDLSDRVVLCESYATNDCVAHASGAVMVDWMQAFPGHRLDHAALVLEWTPETPATETLAFGFMVMATDGESNNTLFGIVEGKSPLTIDVLNANEPLGEGQVLHAFVYNPEFSKPVDQAYVYATTRQPFAVTGTVTVVPSADAV